MTIRTALRVTLSAILGTAALAAAETTYLPGAAEVTGLAGARFSSTLEISNPGAGGTVATIGLVPMAGKAAPAPVTRTLASGESLRIPEALKTLFGLADGAAGTLTVTADEPLLANLTTRNVAAPEGAYGLGLLPVSASDLLGAGETGHSIWVSQSSDPTSGYRTNLSVTLAEPGTVVEVRVLDAEGRVAGTATVTAATPEVWQQAAAALIGAGTDLPVGRAEFEVKAGRATAYAVVNDNVTSDAIALQSERVVPGAADRLISGAALAPGHLGSFWSTDLRLFNPGSTAVDATVLAVGASREASAVVPVPGKGVVEVARVLALLGFPEGTACALRVTAGASLLVAARTNNVDPAGVRKGTFSAQQFVTAWPGGLLGSGSVGFFNGVDQTLNVPGTRTNLTIVGGPEGAAGELVLRDAAGLEQARTAFSRGPGEWGQLGVADWFSSPGASSAGFRGLAATTIPENARIDVSVESGALDAFVSRIDNGSGDAVTRPVALPGGGDCSKVAVTAFGAAPQPILPGVPTTFSWTVALDPPSSELTSQSIRFDGEGEVELGKDVRSYTRTFDSAGARSATLTVRKGSCVKTRSLSFLVCGGLVVEPASLPNGVAYAAYPFRQLTMPGAAGPVTFAVTSGALPEGVVLTPTGILSGVPEEVGTFAVAVTGTDASGCTGSRSYTFSVLCALLQISPSTLPAGTVGVPAAPVQMSVSGGSEVGTWSATGLPPGLALSPSGLLSGTPTAAGSYQVSVRFVDSVGCEGTAAYTIVVCDTLVVTPGTVPAAVAGTPYGPVGFGVAGATGAATWAVTAGALPAGVSLDPGTGVLSGTPTVVGTFPFTVTATDSLGCKGSVAVSLVVSCPVITVNPASLANGTAGVAYGPVGLVQAGGLGAVTWAVTAGALPAGMSLGPDGVLSGTPMVTGTFPFTATTTDANGCTGSRAYTLTIDCPVIALSPASLGNGTAGVAYGPVALTQAGGVGAVTFAVTAGALPDGLGLSPAGVLSGTPTVVGTFGFTVTATDANGCIGTRVYSLVVDCPVITVSPASVPDGTAGVAYPGASFTQAGGVGAITWSIAAGILPTGLSLDPATGVLSGTPLQTGAFPITVRATDANGCFGDRALTLTVLCPTIVVNPASVPNGTAGVAYSGATFTQTGGVGAITWSLFAGVLPNGMSLDAVTGALSGTPLQTGAFPITVRATDANGCFGDRALTLTILCPTIVPSPSAPLGGVEGSAFGPITFTQTGGVGAVLWSSTGTLPAGLTFSTAGVLSGTPEAGSAGEYTVTFTATDQNLCTGSVQITFRICPVVTVGPSPLAAFLQGQPYADTLVGSGGVAPYTFAVTAGALPAGVLLDGATGILSGTPTTLEAYDFTVTATDANGCAGSRQYTGRVCPVITVTTNLPNGVVGAAYSQPLAASGSPDTPYTFSVTAGALPDGVDLVAGVLTGTPTTSGTFTFTITATDTNGCTGSRQYTVEVCVAPTITPTPAAVCAASTGNTAEGPAGATTYLWSILNGTITSVTNAQTVTYTAGASGNVTLTLTVTSGSSCSASTSIDVPINAAPATPTITGVAAGGVCADSTGNTASGPAGATTYAWSITGGTITSATNIQTVTYTANASGSVQLTLVVTNAEGCSASGSVTTAINPAPATPAITGVPAGGVCADSTGNTASGPAGATTYAWSITGGTITSATSIQTVTYTAGASGSVQLTLVVTNAEGCSASGSITTPINANPATPTITPAAAAVCTLSTGNTASGPAGATTYAWSIANGTITSATNAQTVTYTAGASGSVQLTLEVTNASGCSASASLAVPIEPLPTLLPAAGTLFTATFGTAGFSQAFTASGGTGPFAYTISPATPPAGLSFAGGVLSGTPNATGTFSFTVTATNAAGCASASQSYTLAVLPVAAADPYAGLGNTQLYVTGVAGAPTTPAVSSATTALANDLPLGGVSVVPAFVPCVGLGGTMTIDALGRFVYTPPAGKVGPDACTYTVSSDTGGTGVPATATGTVTVTLSNQVWYVRNDAPAGGLGRSNDPFNTLPGAGAASAANDVIFVHRGSTGTTPFSSGITLKDGQKLWGEGIGLTVPPFGTLVPAGLQPRVDATGGDAVSIPATAGNRQNVEVRGLDLAGSGNAVDVTASGAHVVGVTISGNTISGAGAEGIDLNAGSTGAFAATVTNNTITSTGNGLDARTSAATTLTLDLSNLVVTSSANGILVDGSGGGTTFVIGFANNVVSGDTGGTGISVNAATFDATPGGAFQTVSAGTAVVGASGNPVGANGIVLTGASGDLSFADLDVFAGGGAGLRASGTVPYTGSSGIRIVVGAGVATVEATGGPAVDVTQATVTMPFSSIRSTNSATTGVALTSVAGTFSAGSGSSISGVTSAAGTAFQVGSSSATVTYNGTIAATTGKGVDLTSNSGTIGFTGALTLSTGASTAFNATGGGTVTATDTTSTIATTTGVALNVANTTIGAAGLKFRSISAGTGASGPTSGIVLSNTGSSGSLTVSGTGGAGTGGTIQRTTSHGISLTSTLSPSFTSMNVLNTAGSGVKGTGVTNFTFVNGTIDNSGTALGVDASNIAFNDTAAGTENNLAGTVTITGNTLTNAYYHGVDVFNFNGTIADATISNNTITSSTSTATSKGSGIRLVAFGSAATVANVTKATIANNVISNFPSGAGVMAQGGNASAAGPAGVFGTAGSATNLIAITGNRIAGQSAANRMGTQAILAVVNGKGQGAFDVSNNGTVGTPLANITGTAIAVSALGNVTVSATASNNVIAANNTFGSSGIGAGTSQTFGTTDTPNLTLTVNGNTISQTDGNGILVTARDATGTLRARIQNNTVAAPLGGVRPGIRVDAGNGVSVDDAVCLAISGNTSAGSSGSQGIGLRKQGTTTTVNDFAVNGMAATSTPGVEAYVDGLNPAGGGTLLISATSGFSNGACP